MADVVLYMLSLALLLLAGGVIVGLGLAIGVRLAGGLLTRD